MVSGYLTIMSFPQVNGLSALRETEVLRFKVERSCLNRHHTVSYRP